ncbi:MAG TPA: restriction endonuclease subunit S [Comamonas denitrificans]|nr:restriction endonuclease subunit S [Comamonas denitrificans]
MLLSNLNLLATAPGGVARLRELILTLAVQGKLVPQDPADEPASVLLRKIRAEKDRLIAEGKIKKDKPLAAIAEEENPFELPVGWEWVRLAEIAYPQAGFAFKSNGFNDLGSGLPLIRIRDVGGNSPATFFSGEFRPEFVVQPSDWLISMDGEFRVREWHGPISLLNQRVTRLIFCGDELFRPFIAAALQFRLQELQGTKAYTTVDHLSGGQIASAVIPLPPLAEQSRIVARVEELMRLCDALEAKGQLEATQHAQLLSTLLGTLTASATPEELAENWQRVAQHFDLLLDRPQAIDALEQTLLQLAVRGLLVPQDPADEPASVLLQKIRAEKDRLIAEGKIKKDKPLPPVTDEEKPFELPVGWEWVRFGEYFFELCTGPFGSVIHKEDYVEGGVPLINPSHMIGGRISHDPSVSVSLEMSIQLRAYRLSPGDVVLARRGEVGRYALVTEAQDGWLCGTGSFFVKLHDSCNREFFGLVLEDPDLRRHLQGESVGSTMVNLNQRILVETSMALPPLPEQSRIVTRITQLRRLCFELRQRLAEREAVQARLAEALVQQVA